MKRNFLIVLIIFVSIVIITLINLDNTNNNIDINKMKYLNNIDKQVDYFKYNYIDRYINYKKNNPNLSDIDIITRVNLNLDYSFYLKSYKSKYLNKEYVLVNKYIYLPDDYIPNNLVNINNKYSNGTKQLVDYANNSLDNMIKDSLKEGYKIRVVSAYRSYDYQKELYDSYVRKDGIEKADTYSARAGYSEHQTGLVIDVDNYNLDYNEFSKTKEYLWMKDNSYKYGFILRYPEGKENITGYSFEAWHYRYVGKEIAKYIYENNITFDEYYVRFIDNKKD